MTKLLLSLLLATLVACGPQTKKSARPADETVVETGAAQGGSEEKKPAEAAKPAEAPKGSSVVDSDDDDQGKGSVTQSPNQTPVQAPALTIKDIRYGGGACPDASVAANVSPDAKAFTLIFNTFAVEIPENSKNQSADAACELEIDLLSEKGWQLTLLTLDVRGYAALNAGDVATLSTDFSFGASGEAAHFETTLTGAMDDNFQRRAEARLKTAPWSGCEEVKTLRVKLGAGIEAATDLAALLTVDAVDGELHHLAGLAFRRCD